jgi:hypothetical protein
MRASIHEQDGHVVRVTLDGLTVLGQMMIDGREDDGLTYQRLIRGEGPVWVWVGSIGRTYAAEVVAQGKTAELLTAAYEAASYQLNDLTAVDVQPVRSACFRVAEQHAGITARDVARRMAEAFGWKIDDDAEDAMQAAAAELGIELRGKAV